ncbi:MAG: hypothetical protein RJA61_745 [Candidatus Parcubacteria bacterium]
MLPFFSKDFYNPSALYAEGVYVRKIIESARARIAYLVNVTSGEIVFTGGGTESNNLALRGVYAEAKKRGIEKPHIITSSIEHPAVLETCRALEREGALVTYIKPNEKGIVNSQDVQSACTKDTVLISLMYVNNEIGTIQPIKDVARGVQKIREENKSLYPVLHTDASQAPNYLSCHMQALGVDLMTLDGSKIYGPKGVGVLVVKRKTPLQAIVFGGGQEGGIRPGTENVPLIVGFAHALEETVSFQKTESERLGKLSSYFLERLLKEFPKINLNGDSQKRIPNIINVCIGGLDAEFAVLKLDRLGIACAHVTSCKTSDTDSSSYVIKALGQEKCASSSLRFTLGRETTKKDIDATVTSLKKVI